MILAHSTHTWLPITEHWISRQVKHISGVEQIVLCDKKDPAYPELVKTIYNPSSPLSFTNRLRNKLGMPDAFRDKTLKGYNDLILLSHYGGQGYADLKLKKKKHITRFYGYDLTRTIKSDAVWKDRYKRLFDECDSFIVEGNYMKKVLHSLGCPKEKIFTSFLGADIEEIKYKPREESKILNVMIACATAERKGIIFALKAIERAINYYNIPIHVHWVGARTNDYPEYVKYENLLNDFINYTKLRKNITKYGFVTPAELQSIAQLCQVAIHPSVWAADGDCEGGYPVVLVDLMATGLPVISTTHCDIPELVNRQNGYLAPEREVDPLIGALVDSYNNKTYVAKSFLSRKTVKEKFNWKTLGGELSEIILR